MAATGMGRSYNWPMKLQYLLSRCACSCARVSACCFHFMRQAFHSFNLPLRLMGGCYTRSRGRDTMQAPRLVGRALQKNNTIETHVDLDAIHGACGAKCHELLRAYWPAQNPDASVLLDLDF